MTNQTEQGAADPVRAAFEAKFAPPPHALRMERYGRRAELAGQYKSFQTELAWDGYQAGRAAVSTPEGCTSVAKVREAVDLLERITSGSCSCLTKTPDPHHHKTGCQYKMIREAIDLLEPATPGSHQHD